MGGQIAAGVIITLICAAIISTYLVQGRPPRRSRVLASARRSTRRHPARARVDAAVGRWRLVRQFRQAQQRRSLQRVATDLRRLRRLIAEDHNDSATHQFAHRMAYDQLMVEACTMLSVPHGLGPELTGRDRELERYRTEANLQAAGVVLLPRVRERLD